MFLNYVEIIVNGKLNIWYKEIKCIWCIGFNMYGICIDYLFYNCIMICDLLML